jgi:hypothetical protein
MHSSRLPYAGNKSHFVCNSVKEKMVCYTLKASFKKKKILTISRIMKYKSEGFYRKPS